MKFASALGYVVLFAFQAYLAFKVQRIGIQHFEEGAERRNSLTFFIGLLGLLTSFLQFWLLTRIFPLPLIGLLVGASVLASMISFLIGAVFGFTLEEKKEKIEVLSAIWVMQRPAFGCTFLALGVLLVPTALVGCLAEFFRHPIGDPHAKVWIAFFLFILPQITLICSAFVGSWQIITSEFVDDDLRNSSLASSFSGIAYNTISLLFPIWLLRNEIPEVLGRPLPPFWALLSIPFLLFILGSLLPFFVGVYRYRAQSRFMLKWQENWLTQLDALIKLPVGRTRTEAVDEKLAELDGEIRDRISRNQLLQRYRSLIAPDAAGQEASVPALLTPGAGTPGEEVTQDGGAVVVENSRDQLTKNKIQEAKQFLRGHISRPGPGQDLQATILEKYRSQLTEWDIRFKYLWELLELYKVSLAAKTEDISGFVEARLRNVKSAGDGVSARSNVMAGGAMATLSSVTVFLFKTYQNEILHLIGRLAQHK